MPPLPSDLHLRHAHKDYLTENLPEHLQDRKLVGIDGLWYDVTDFIHKHPGGPVLEHFIGQDATAIFHAQGHKDVLKHRKPVGTYTVPVRHPADDDFEKLVKEFHEKGYFTTDFSYYVKKSIFIFCLLACVFCFVIKFESFWMHMLGAVFLTFVWQQSALVMHDFMHSQVFRKHSIDRVFGVFFGTTVFGISAHWWRDEHILHHGLCNTVDVSKNWADPQMWELSWAQNTKLFPLFKQKMDYYMIKIQQFTFVPVVVLIGRYEIIWDSFRKEKRPIEWVGIFFHVVWLSYLLSHLPNWGEVALFYVIAATYEGWLHFQLILSHYCKLFCTIEEYHSTSWYVVQTLSNLNIKNPWYWDWYYGGLNYHIEHHLFPTMSRKYLRTASDRVREVCKKHDIEYDYCTIVEALVKTLKHLKDVGSKFKLQREHLG